MPSQLRIYEIRPGTIEEFAARVEAEIFPLRLAHGFTIEGPWLTDAYQYVWILHYEGEGTFEKAVERYYNDPRRGEMTFDPMDYITAVDKRMMRPL